VRGTYSQQITTLIIKAELLALVQAVKESLFINRLLAELIIRLNNYYIKIQYNNKQTIWLVIAKIATL